MKAGRSLFAFPGLRKRSAEKHASAHKGVSLGVRLGERRRLLWVAVNAVNAEALQWPHPDLTGFESSGRAATKYADIDWTCAKAKSVSVVPTNKVSVRLDPASLSSASLEARKSWTGSWLRNVDTL